MQYTCIMIANRQIAQGSNNLQISDSHRIVLISVNIIAPLEGRSAASVELCSKIESCSPFKFGAIAIPIHLFAISV